MSINTLSGVRDVVGGRTYAYEEQLKNAIDAISSMTQKAEKDDSNAIIGIRIKYNNLGGLRETP